MKTTNFIFLAAVLVILFLSGCGNRNQEIADQKKDSAYSATPEQPVSPGGTAKMAGTPDPQMPESTNVTLPVYALWVNRKENNRTYDGMYDSQSKLISLCEDKTTHRIDDSTELVFNANNHCYKTTLFAYHMTIGGDSVSTIFLDLFAFDSTNSSLIGIAPSGDTIMAHFNYIEPVALKRLQFDLEKNKTTEEKMQIMQHYQQPEMKKINIEKMKMNTFKKQPG